MNFKDLEVFVAVVTAGSLAAAGRRLGLSSMAVTRALAALEAELDTRLVHRTTRSIALTPEGETFLPYARSILDLGETARGSVVADPEVASGTLRVTCPHVFGRAVMVPILHLLQQAHPKLGVELIMGDELLDIVDEGIDIAIRFAHPKDSRLVGRLLSDNPRSLYAAPSYLEQQGQPSSLTELASHRGVRTLAMTAWPFMVNNELRMVPIPGRFASCSAEGVKEACLQGMGLALLSRWDVESEVQAGLLVPIKLHDAEPQNLPIWAMMPTAKNVPTRVSMLVEALQERLRD